MCPFQYLPGGAWNRYHETYRAPTRPRSLWRLRKQEVPVSIYNINHHSHVKKDDSRLILPVLKYPLETIWSILNCSTPSAPSALSLSLIVKIQWANHFWNSIWYWLLEFLKDVASVQIVQILLGLFLGAYLKSVIDFWLLHMHQQQDLTCCVVLQISGPRTRIGRWAVWLSSEERPINTQRGPSLLPANHFSPGFLPQPLHLVSLKPYKSDSSIETHQPSIESNILIQLLIRTDKCRCRLLTYLPFGLPCSVGQPSWPETRKFTIGR